MSTHRFGPDFLRRAGLLIGAATLLHVLVLGGADWFWPSTAPPPLPTALEVRLLAPAPAAPAAVPADASDAKPPRPAAAVARRLAASSAVAKPSPGGAVPPQPAVVAAAAPPAAVATQAATVEGDDAPAPLYRTRMPPPATLRYELTRGPLRGIGELHWRPQADRYELALEFRLDGLTILSQLSSGAFDMAGIAPVRFTDRRARRGATAANFQREAGKLSYSGSRSEFALRPGMQDRLSWLLQLAAIVAAESSLQEPGAQVGMFVTGARGDGGLWVFRCLGPEPLDTRDGPRETLRFERVPREPYDTTVQVWLDPQRSHLPVRATQKSGTGDEGYDMRLVEVGP